MKKIICLLLSIILFSFSFTASAINEYSDEELETAQKVLVDLGLWQDFDVNYDYITRADACAYICMIENVYNDFSLDKREPLADVNIDHWAYDYIWFAHTSSSPVGRRVFEGDEKGLFRPDDFCTYSEFIKMLLVTIGWDAYTFLNGGYPDGYFYIAEKLGIYSLNEKDMFVKKNDAIILIYNLLKLPMLVQDGYGTELHLKLGIPILQLRKNIFQTRGLAKKNIDMSISIDGKIFQGCIEDDNFIEGFVLCYYKHNKETKISTIVTCYPISSLAFDNPKIISDELLKKIGDGVLR